MEKKISVIIPIYNTGNYLEKCVNSVINQTYKNLEIILVNDGSTDNSNEICENFKKEDSRIIYINKKNTGVSDSRNLAINKSSGEYILFVDSDDYIEDTMIESLYNDIKKYDADLACCEYVSKNRKQQLKLLNKNEMLSVILKEKGTSGYIWDKLYKTSIIKNEKILFDKEIYICEDMLFNARYIEKANKFIWTNKQLYNYIYRPNSVLNQEFNQKWNTILKAFKEMKNIYVNNDCFDEFLAHYILAAINLKTKMYLHNYINNNLTIECNRIINENIKQINMKRISFKIQIKVFIYYRFHKQINYLKKKLGKK